MVAAGGYAGAPYGRRAALPAGAMGPGLGSWRRRTVSCIASVSRLAANIRVAWSRSGQAGAADAGPPALWERRQRRSCHKARAERDPKSLRIAIWRSKQRRRIRLDRAWAPWGLPHGGADAQGWATTFSIWNRTRAKGRGRPAGQGRQGGGQASPIWTASNVVVDRVGPGPFGCFLRISRDHRQGTGRRAAANGPALPKIFPGRNAPPIASRNRLPSRRRHARARQGLRCIARERQ